MAIRNTSLSWEEIDRHFREAKKIFFIGIGGVGMSALAEYCAFLGKEIYGYDKVKSPRTDRLEKIGRIKYYSTPDNVGGMDMVIYTNAIDESNFEYRRAKKLKLCLISRANFLGYIAYLHKNRIGISGMHGKSTTTSMLAHIFEYGCKSPTVFCGAEMKEFNGESKFGGGEWCIFEACEYQNSFLSLPVTHAGILNIDLDHPDFFSSLEEIKKSFREYAKKAKYVYLNADDENSKGISHPNMITFGFGKNAIYRGEIIEKSDTCRGVSVKNKDFHSNLPKQHFRVYKKETFLTECAMSLCGKHFVYDALCAFAIAHTSGIEPKVISEALNDFQGSKRRMEFIKKTDTGVDFFEDYAHHPKEISASLSSLKEMGYKNIFCIFQPHTYSRTYYLYNEFTRCFKDAKELIICPVFSAREENVFELSEESFSHDCGADYVKDLSTVKNRILNTSCDCVVIMGAGDINYKKIMQES